MIIVSVFAVGLLQACECKTRGSDNSYASQRKESLTHNTVEIEKNGVRCFIYKNGHSIYAGAGISCLPKEGN